MTRNSNALKCDGSMMVNLDLAAFLRGSTDSAIYFSGAPDLHTSIHPPSPNLESYMSDLLKSCSGMTESQPSPQSTKYDYAYDRALEKNLWHNISNNVQNYYNYC